MEAQQWVVSQKMRKKSRLWLTKFMRDINTLGCADLFIIMNNSFLFQCVSHVKSHILVGNQILHQLIFLFLFHQLIHLFGLKLHQSVDEYFQQHTLSWWPIFRAYFWAKLLSVFMFHMISLAVGMCVCVDCSVVQLMLHYLLLVVRYYNFASTPHGKLNWFGTLSGY